MSNKTLDKVVEMATKRERARILDLIRGFWCGEPECPKHPIRMDWVIAAIKGENNDQP